MKAIGVALTCALLIACGNLPPPTQSAESTPAPVASPSQSEQPSPEPTLTADQLAPPPPTSVTDDLAMHNLLFEPLTLAERRGVQLPADAAQRLALTTAPQEFGDDGDTVVWKRVGCVFLGWYRGRHMPRLGYVPETYPAYIVQVIGDPVKGWPDINVMAVVINAETGDRGARLGASPPLMGTTCGAAV